MNQSQREDDTIKKMSILLPQRQRRVKVLAHFDQSLEDSSIYNRTPIKWGSIQYYSGTNRSMSGYSVGIVGNNQGVEGSTKRHNGYVAYDISDVDLSGPFCIDYWHRNIGSYSDTTPMKLVPLDVEDPLFDSFTSPLQHLDTNDSRTGFYTYDPTTDTRLVAKVSRNAKLNHIAVTRDIDNVLRWFYNGTLIASYTNSFDFSSKEIEVGNMYSNDFDTHIEIDELRVVTGTPWYTSDFTPRTTPYTTLDVE